MVERTGSDSDQTPHGQCYRYKRSLPVKEATPGLTERLPFRPFIILSLNQPVKLAVRGRDIIFSRSEQSIVSISKDSIL